MDSDRILRERDALSAPARVNGPSLCGESSAARHGGDWRQQGIAWRMRGERRPVGRRHVVPDSPRVVASEFATRFRQRGSTFLEFAVVFPLFGLLMMGTADVGRSLFYLTTLQHAVREAGRFVMTGNTVPGMTRPESVVWAIRRYSRIHVDEENIDVSSISADGSVKPGPGGPGDVVAINVRYDVPMITPLLGALLPQGHYTVSAATTFKNEEFQPGDAFGGGYDGPDGSGDGDG